MFSVESIGNLRGSALQWVVTCWMFAWIGVAVNELEVGLWKDCCLEGVFGELFILLERILSPGMDSAREGGGVTGTVLIPMNFVWSYGGRSVYLSGSFTGWDLNAYTKKIHVITI